MKPRESFHYLWLITASILFLSSHIYECLSCYSKIACFFEFFTEKLLYPGTLYQKSLFDIWGLDGGWSNFYHPTQFSASSPLAVALWLVSLCQLLFSWKTSHKLCSAIISSVTLELFINNVTIWELRVAEVWKCSSVKILSCSILISFVFFGIFDIHLGQKRAKWCKSWYLYKLNASNKRYGAVRKCFVWWSSEAGGKDNPWSQLGSTCSRMWPYSPEMWWAFQRLYVCGTLSLAGLGKMVCGRGLGNVSALVSEFCRELLDFVDSYDENTQNEGRSDKDQNPGLFP